MSFKRVAFEGISGLPQLPLCFTSYPTPCSLTIEALPPRSLQKLRSCNWTNWTAPEPRLSPEISRLKLWRGEFACRELLITFWDSFHFSFSSIWTDALAGLHRAHDFAAVQHDCGSSGPGPWRNYKNRRNATLNSYLDSMQHGKLLCAYMCN